MFIETSFARPNQHHALLEFDTYFLTYPICVFLKVIHSVVRYTRYFLNPFVIISRISDQWINNKFVYSVKNSRLNYGAES